MEVTREFVGPEGGKSRMARSRFKRAQQLKVISIRSINILIVSFEKSN